MRVLLVANTLPPLDVSGVGEQVLQLAAGLRRDGFEVEILGRGAGAVTGPKVLFPLFVVPALWRRLRRFRPHVVQVHESDGGLAALLVAWLAPALTPAPRLVALLQVSYLEELRAVRPLFGGDPRQPSLGRPSAVEMRFRRVKAPLQIALGWLTARAADRVLAPSAATAEEIRRDYGVTAVAVVPNVTGGAEPAPATVATAATLATDDGEPAEPDGYLLVVGRLRIRKGVDVLLAALPEVLARHPATRLLIAGDGEHRGALERQAEELGLGAAARFLGRCSGETVRRLLQGAVALVVPSVYEGMPLVVLEAMAAAVPVVASRVSGIPEVVVDGTTGWLVPPENAAALASALIEVVADPTAARRRGAEGLRRVDERFRPAQAVEAWRRAVLHDPLGTSGTKIGVEEERMVSS